jgi:hypothetical protein
LIEKHPPARSTPRANVEVAAVDVMLSAVVCSPPANVDVAVPWTTRKPVVVAPPEIVSPPAWVPLPIVVEESESKPAKSGVPVKVGLAEKTALPVPVSSESKPARSAEVCREEEESFAFQTEAEEIWESASVPPMRLAPMVEVETSLPEESVPRSAEVRAVRYVVPELVSCVVEAWVAKVEEAASDQGEPVKRIWVEVAEARTPS